jgi:hypothetical protein
MNLKELKQRFPESASEIEFLESLGFFKRSKSWLDGLDSEKVSTACWLIRRFLRNELPIIKE